MTQERTTTQTKDSLNRNTAEYARLKAIADTINGQLDELKLDILADMEDLGMQKFPTDEYTYSIFSATTNEKVNKKLLKTQYPNVFAQVISIENKKGGLRVNKAKATKKEGE